MTNTDSGGRLEMRRGLNLEYPTPRWIVVGVILVVTAIRDGIPALAWFGLDSRIAIAAALAAFLALVLYLTAQLACTLIGGALRDPSPLGSACAMITCLVITTDTPGKA